MRRGYNNNNNNNNNGHVVDSAPSENEYQEHFLW